MPVSLKEAEAHSRDKVVSGLLNYANAAHVAYAELEQRFRETVGLCRALEASSADPAAKAIAALVRRDYEELADALCRLEVEHFYRY